MVCPLIEVCDAQVTFEHYSGFCAAKGVYRTCTNYLARSADKKTPKDWRDQLGGHLKLEES